MQKNPGGSYGSLFVLVKGISDRKNGEQRRKTHISMKFSEEHIFHWPPNVSMQNILKTSTSQGECAGFTLASLMNRQFI